jgi:hypothetical protein
MELLCFLLALESYLTPPPPHAKPTPLSFPSPSPLFHTFHCGFLLKFQESIHFTILKIIIEIRKQEKQKQKQTKNGKLYDLTH